MSVCCECCVLSGTGLCDGPIPRPRESYRVSVRHCVIRCNNNPVPTVSRYKEVRLRKNYYKHGECETLRELMTDVT